MPFVNGDALSDDDEGANLKKGQVSGEIIPEKTPENVAAAAAVKSKAKPKKAASKAKAKSAAKTKATSPSDAEPVKEKLVAKGLLLRWTPHRHLASNLLSKNDRPALIRLLSRRISISTTRTTSGPSS